MPLRASHSQHYIVVRRADGCVNWNAEQEPECKCELTRLVVFKRNSLSHHHELPWSIFSTVALQVLCLLQWSECLSLRAHGQSAWEWRAKTVPTTSIPTPKTFMDASTLFLLVHLWLRISEQIGCAYMLMRMALSLRFQIVANDTSSTCLFSLLDIHRKCNL